ncbi:MAG: hypothetical protein M1120_03150 [Patescibacteria group bacterium]|nr:hypothetical protein [Patescibacteria group bacterium]
MSKERTPECPFDDSFIEPIPVGVISDKLQLWFSKIPPDQLYLTPKVLRGHEHSLKHLISEFVYVNYFGAPAQKYAKANDLPFNLAAQEIVAIFHDSQRQDDKTDPTHAEIAAKKIAGFDMRGKIPAKGSDINTAISVCARHNEKPNGNDLMDFNLLFFRWCDGLQWVRYEDTVWESEEPTFKEVTAQFLNRIFPNSAPDNMLRSFIVSARVMNRHIDYLMKERGIAPDSLEVVDICLEAGKRAGFLI